MPSTFNAACIEDEVRKILKTVSHGIRPKIAERIIEWWDSQAALSLMKKRPRTIRQAELLTQLHDVVASFQDANLPYGTQPETNIKRQIDLVDGEEWRIWRATLEHWRAHSQRAHWLRDGPPVSRVTF